jgi:hypothetical protein
MNIYLYKKDMVSTIKKTNSESFYCLDENDTLKIIKI